MGTGYGVEGVKIGEGMKPTMTNRIGGDFNHDAIEAFRAAYAQQLASPDQEDIANNSGLPTNTIPNTSPWIEHTGIWRYPSGKGPDEDLKTPFNPNVYLSDEVVDGEEEIESMSDEEVENLINEIAGSSEGDED
jgi:hypothetical protein